jgi:hypothetical protein
MQLIAFLPVILSLVLNPLTPSRPVAGDSTERARELAALFNKSKHKVKDKRGVHIEIHIDIVSEPLVKPAAQYSGEYGADDTFSLRLEVGADGKVTGRGSEPRAGTAELNFSLRDARVDGGLVVGTKVYDSGATAKFEGVFIQRTVHTNMGDRDQVLFGLGVVFDPPKRGGDDGWEINKLFYEAR